LPTDRQIADTSGFSLLFHENLLHTVSLKKPHEFRRLFAKGKSAAGPFFVIYVRTNGTSQNKVGITASAKLGNAVTRNKIKRRVREAYRLSEPKLKYGFDIAVVLRQGAVSAEFLQIQTELNRIAKKLGITR